MKSPSPKYRQRSTGRKYVGRFLHFGCRWFAVASILDLQPPPFQDLANGVHGRSVASHQQRGNRSEIGIQSQGFSRPFETVRANHDVWVEERKILDVRVDLAEPPVAATRKAAVDLLFHQCDPPIVKTLDNLPGLVLRNVVHDHHPLDPDRSQERIEAGWEIARGVVAHHHCTNAHRDTPGLSETDGR
jgi:hypothetical protein